MLALVLFWWFVKLARSCSQMRLIENCDHVGGHFCFLISSLMLRKGSLWRRREIERRQNRRWKRTSHGKDHNTTKMWSNEKCSKDGDQSWEGFAWLFEVSAEKMYCTQRHTQYQNWRGRCLNRNLLRHKFPVRNTTSPSQRRESFEDRQRYLFYLWWGERGHQLCCSFFLS